MAKILQPDGGVVDRGPIEPPAEQPSVYGVISQDAAADRVTMSFDYYLDLLIERDELRRAIGKLQRDRGELLAFTRELAHRINVTHGRIGAR